MTIRSIPLNTPEPESELVPLDEVARRLNISIETLRRWIKADIADGKGRVPGSRGEGSRYVVIRSIFERAMRQGIEPERLPTIVTPDLDEYVQFLRRRAAEDMAKADQLSAAIHDTRKAS